jgi:hypothetical protein
MRAWVRVVTVPEYQAYIERLGQDLKKSQDIIFQAQKSQDSQ